MAILFRVACMLVVILACAAPPRIPVAGSVPKYPPRPANCALRVFYTPEPAIVAWDDLGVAQVTCHLDTAQPECMQRFQAEACRMGADLLYDVPKKPLRPKEQAIGFRGRAAHSRAPFPNPNNPPVDGRASQ